MTVAFAAEKGRVLSSLTMLFAMMQSMELPAAGRPTPDNPSAITISEFMAAPTNGTDWVELRNATNVDGDVTAWPTGVAHAKLGLPDEGEALGLATPVKSGFMVIVR